MIVNINRVKVRRGGISAQSRMQIFFNRFLDWLKNGIWVYNFCTMFNLKSCCLCPRMCKVDRINGTLGYCQSNDGFNIAAICKHLGEEPPIGGNKGVCNVFFSHCNLQCTYCQNRQISGNTTPIKPLPSNKAIHSIKRILDSGVNTLGFVSPSHMIMQVKQIIKSLHRESYYPTIVFNTNAYDRTEVLADLSDLSNIY